ncbi:hypothetical protein ABIA33_007099 [Streptacidiphilus sp. MAP12-16]|uniref:hypothetical protein n=1 Tax=Streptacidiphilus sp. MAP12-16 TaxID=3156300 RepID=UPI0035146F0C
MSRLDASPTSVNGDTEVRHLAPGFALGALHRGKQIEQFLGEVDRDGRRGLRWIAISPDRTGVTIYLSEVEDAGTDTFYDVSEFPPLDPDDGTWGKEIATVLTPEEALIRACSEPGVNPDRWVNEGVICDEYRDFRIASRNEHPATP